MILTLTNSNQNASYWKAERFVLSAGSTIAQSGGKVRIWCSMTGSKTSPIASYMQTYDDDLKIDITDLVRTYKPTYVYWCLDADEELGTTRTITITYSGLISPERVIIPQHKFSNAGARGYVIPPRMYYAGNQQSDVEAELYKTSGTWVVTGDAVLSMDGRNVGQIAGDFTLSNGAVTLAYRLRRMRCDTRYVLVKWVSFTGAVREHIFECTKAKQSTKDAFSLLQFDNAYSEIKGREDGFTLRLDNLDLYDMWYYADVLQSSSVQISFDGQTYYSAQVLDKSITLPDGEAGTNGILEIAINYKKYDAVVM